MGWTKTIVGGLILTIVLLSLASSFTAYLLVSHQSCSPGSTSIGTSKSVSGNSSPGLSPAAAPLALASSDLVLAPLANLSLSQSAPPDLTDLAFWGEVDTSQLQTYEQIVPQTVIGFFNSSEEWRAWAQQHLPNPPDWLNTGFVAEAQSMVAVVDPAGRGNESATAVERGVNDFAASVAGVSLASLDFVSFNGLTGLKTLFETNNPLLAACQTLPGQLAQLYESSFDFSLPQAERADYLGRALAITSVMLLVGGSHGIADHFQTALDGLGLGDAWPAVKSYLGDIASKVSAGASSTAFGILQTLAGRFPSDSTFVTGFTADRVDSMVGVLEKKGVPDSTVQADIEHVAEVANTSPDEQAPGEAADVSSLKDGGGVLLKIKAQNKIVLYTDATGRTANIRGVFLQQVIQGFDPRGPNFVAIHYKEAGVTFYHYYEQKVDPNQPFDPQDTEWNPRAPKIAGNLGDIITVTFELLTADKFLKSIPSINYLNTAHASWVADFSEVTNFESVGDMIIMNVVQERLEGVTSFKVEGRPGSLTNIGGDTFLPLTVSDAVNVPENLKLTFNGYGEPILSFESGSNFGQVILVSSDGVKLKIVYDSGGGSTAVATIYLQQPLVLWRLPIINAEGFGFSIPGASQTYTLRDVVPVRGLEREMVNSGNKYDLARVGAEIAYSVSQQEFGVENIRLNEPSEGGADLISGDRSVTVQARMLGNPSALSPSNLETTLSFEMNDLAKQIHTDFDKNASAQTGYAILSYLDPTSKTIVTLVAVIQRQ